MNISENCMFRAHIAAMCIMGRGPISSSRIRQKRRGAVQPFSQRGTHRRHAEEFKQEFCKTNFMVVTPLLPLASAYYVSVLKKYF